MRHAGSARESGLVVAVNSPPPLLLIGVSTANVPLLSLSPSTVQPLNESQMQLYCLTLLSVIRLYLFTSIPEQWYMSPVIPTIGCVLLWSGARLAENTQQMYVPCSAMSLYV